MGIIFKGRMKYSIKSFTEFNVETVHELPIESMVLITSDKVSAYVGSLVYTRKSRHGSSFSIDFDSLREDRKVPVGNLVYEMLCLRLTGAISEATLIADLQFFVKFGYWADENEYFDYLAEPEQYRLALSRYTQALLESLKLKKITKNTASNSQRAPYEKWCLLFMGTDINVVEGISKISSPSKGEANNKKNSEKYKLVDLVFPYHVALFRGLAKLVCEFESFPFKLEVPGENIWIVPSKFGFALSHSQLAKQNFELNVWNAEDGCLRNIDEFSNDNKKYVSKKLDSAKQALDGVNKNQQHEVRKYLAKFAHDSFLVAFVTITGINEGDVRRMPWSDDYTISRTGIGLKSVKHRASKVVEYHITDVFEKDLLLYFELRKYMLGGQNFEYFFVGQYSKYQKKTKDLPPEALHVGAITRHGERVRKNINPSIPTLSYQILRGYRSAILLRDNDPEIAADLSNHSVGTLRRHYIHPSTSEAEYELTLFYNRVLLRVDEFKEGLRSIPSGQCDGYGNPLKLIKVATIEPDCQDFRGCLFCEHYVIHATSEDILKLYCLLFVMYASADNCDSEAIFKEIYGPLIERVNKLLEGIANRSTELSDLCNQIKEQVFKYERLTPYWAHCYDVISLVGSSL